MDNSEKSFLEIIESEQNFINKATIEFQYSNRNLAIRCNELIEKIFATQILSKMDEAFGFKSFHGINLELASYDDRVGHFARKNAGFSQIGYSKTCRIHYCYLPATNAKMIMR
ncbi:hypothetical protein [Cognataquiflexum rubidum]|uniref:hypothetical protein n=1 Tax=Cognataquiflexum rubidum TaxID=2922273 RepID=UPI001F1481DB|nr:hypothetical protein [Cognataquiflexum rubidum]MCH6236373.1 hypothetical protein [Cognataquiflexum rubidum]